ncbi:MAG: TolC family protein [Methylococcaceae bacterium]
MNLSRLTRCGGLLLWLSGCADFSARIDTGLDEAVHQRLERSEYLTLSSHARQAPETVEQGLARMKQQPPSPIGPSAVSDAVSTAPAHIDLPLADARARALQHNLDLVVARMDPAVAGTLVSEEEARFDDLIFAKARFSRKQTPPYDGEVAKFTDVDPLSPLNGETVKLTEIAQTSEYLDIEAGVSIPLRTGARVTLSVPFDEKRTFQGVRSDQYRSALRFSISQPLLRDAGLNVNQAGIRMARYEQRVTDIKTRLQAIRVLAAVDKAYWALWSAWGELDVRRQQYENAAQNLGMVRKRITEGLTAAVEANRAEVGVAERLEGVIVAETSVKIRQRQLKLLMNDPALPLDAPTWVNPALPPLLVAFDFDRPKLVEHALGGRLELLELELKLASDLTKIDYLDNQTLPQFMLEYSYGSLGRNDAWGSSFTDSLGGDYPDWAVGVRMEMPLTNELRKSRLRRAVYERQQRLSTRQLRELTVRREIHDALDQMQQNWQRILAARQNVIVAGINYEAEQKQFREGLRTMTEVLESLTRLGEARIREVRAISDYQQSQVDLAFATGTLLGYSRVNL